MKIIKANVLEQHKEGFIVPFLFNVFTYNNVIIA